MGKALKVNILRLDVFAAGHKDEENCFNIFSYVKFMRLSSSPSTTWVHYNIIYTMQVLMELSTLNTPKQNVIWYNLMKPNQIYHGGKAEVDLPKLNMTKNPEFVLQCDIERELVDCGKSIFIGDNDEIDRWQRYLGRTYKSIKFYVGRNPIPLIKNAWNFNVHPGKKGERIPTLFKNAMEGGILKKEVELEGDLFLKIRQMQTAGIPGFLKSTKLVESTSPGMGGSIQTIFIIWSALVVLSAGMFLIELCTEIWRKIVFRSKEIGCFCKDRQIRPEIVIYLLHYSQ